jgi:hypothetical protein
LFACFWRLVVIGKLLGTKVCLHPLSLSCATSGHPQVDGKYTPPTAKQLPKQYGWMVHTMNELMALLQGQGSNTDQEDINFLVMQKKLELAAT